MKLNFSAVLTNLAGDPVKDELGFEIKLSRLLAHSLTFIQRHPQMHKLYGWTRSLWDNDCIEVDKEDLKLFKVTVENFEQGMNIFSKGQVFDVIEETEERLKNKEKTPANTNTSNGQLKDKDRVKFENENKDNEKKE